MNPLLLGPLFEIGKTLIDRMLPDPEQKAEAERELIRLSTEAEFRQAIAQLEINAKEAQHASIFVAGWRPGAGWAGVAGFAYATIAQPVLAWLAAVKGWPEPPAVDAELLLYVLGGLLGLAGLRTVETNRGTVRKSL
jgi:hypothetical protein